MSGHPSLLRLDRLAAGASDAEASAHLEACEACRAHVGRVQQPPPIPAWLGELEKPAKPRWAWLAAILAGSLALNGAAAVALLLRPAAQQIDYTYTATKGAPSIGVYVKRGGRVTLWDGRSPLQAGDALQLKVNPEGYTHLTLSAPSPGGLVELYSRDVDPGGQTLLDKSFTLDDSPGDEVLLAVFTRVQPPDAHALRLVLRKRAAR